MRDRLIYRFPGESIVVQEGTFIAIDDIERFEGFVVSDFAGTCFFGFREGDDRSQTYLWEDPVPVIEKEAYLRQAKTFIAKIAAEKLGKAVLSRVKQVAANEPEVERLFHGLEVSYPDAFCYTFSSELLGTWVGATPETLITVDHNRGTTIALAGTKEASDTLEWEIKEQTEQSLVTDYIFETLQKYASNVHLSQRNELRAGPVKHLVHRFSFDIDHWPDRQFLQSLHPTPAVSGFPKDKALRLIAESEEHNRRLYAGIIGCIHPTNTRLFVNLRCAEMKDGDLYLYVGGGLTPDSIPEKEWDETENKAKTILNVLQNQ